MEGKVKVAVFLMVILSTAYASKFTMQIPELVSGGLSTRNKTNSITTTSPKVLGNIMSRTTQKMASNTKDPRIQHERQIDNETLIVTDATVSSSVQQLDLHSENVATDSTNTTNTGLTPDINQTMGSRRSQLDNVTNTKRATTQKVVKFTPWQNMVAFISRRWGIPIFSVIGLVLNGLSIAVMRRPSIKVSVVSVYITSLSLVNILFLVVSPLWDLDLYFSYKLRDHKVPCIILKYTRGLTYGLSSWIITVVAIERSLVVLFPFQATTLSNKKKAKVTLFVITLANMILFSPDIFTSINDKKGCFAQPPYRYYEEKIRFLLIGVLTSYVPFSIIIICNVLLVWKIITAKRNSKSLSSGKASSSYNVSKFTSVGLVMCITYLILTVPSMGILLISKVNNWAKHRTFDTAFSLNFALLVTVIRAAVDSFVCVCWSRTMRIEMVKMFKMKCMCGGGNKWASKPDNKFHRTSLKRK